MARAERPARIADVEPDSFLVSEFFGKKLV